MANVPFPRDLWWRPLRVWLALAWFAAWGLRPENGLVLRPREVGLCLLCGALLSGMGSQSALFLGLARRGEVPLRPGAAPYRLWKLAPKAVLWGLVGGVPGISAGVLFAWLGAMQWGLFVGANLVVLGAFWVQRRKVLRDLRRIWSSRSDSLTAWLVFDTALPAGLLAAALAAGIAWLRLGHLDWVPASTLSRHLGATLLLYSFLLGPGAAIKVGRERLSGLVKAPETERILPGPIIAGGVCSLLLLVLGPRLLPTLAFSDVLLLKITFSGCFGACLAYLGARRGSCVHQYQDQRRREG